MLTKSLANFLCKGQIIHVLGFGDHMVTVKMIVLYCYSTKAAIDTYKQISMTFSNKTLNKKTRGEQFEDV